MLSLQEAHRIMDTAEQIYSAAAITETVNRMAQEITASLSNQYPLVLCVMGGAVVFTGQLLPLLNFPLNFDYLHITRYNNEIHPGQTQWKVLPRENLKGRVVLIIDDILDKGVTLATIREQVMRSGATAFYSAVFVDKEISKPKPIQADFVGVTLPDRYLFGFGMDIQGAWRNLPAIYAIKQ
ncbi:hypoxanthine phosphoribosyltransferase [Nitrosomonas cryotolerans]|uniref:Hypoxanthine phosphoribosyltransferase n=1 Tax=Nitrosomonas cryotolerans ATCC 49181 TaxID=1131553 RepID=A0A1N6I3K7_9PROT|nr:hypoxanthine-guanine phosphoribosyltransferase [Nitrosomonas cryotolerans]SFP59269.1 hypoxanthine phosphoribosyltransferase [Nitrosomonas cryotolerans]SIO26505.1 hypoxanthine phosphoribosyltransferase [Nitrosomonas cryotolerans ATCC 49181]